MSRKQFLFFLVFWFFGCFQAKRSPFDISTPSGVTFNIFTIELQKQRVATPTFSPSAGVITSFTKITISTSASGATIYYTQMEAIQAEVLFNTHPQLRTYGLWRERQ